MGWSRSDFFIEVCDIATKYVKGYPDRISVLIALIYSFENQDFDVVSECFDQVKDLEAAYFLCYPEEKEDWIDGKEDL